MQQELPFSQAAENNKEAIAPVLRKWLEYSTSLLEIGSGTGQHAVFFANLFPQIIWQCADQLPYHDAITSRIKTSGLTNMLPVIALEAMSFDWDSVRADAVFTANTAHIMPWEAVVATLEGVSHVLPVEGVLLWYGPFNIDGEFTSKSNADFDRYLKSQGKHMGIRDRQAMKDQAHQNGLEMVGNAEMPANNQILVFKKRT